MQHFISWLYYAPMYIEITVACAFLSLLLVPICFAMKFEDILMLLCVIALFCFVLY